MIGVDLGPSRIGNSPSSLIFSVQLTEASTPGHEVPLMVSRPSWVSTGPRSVAKIILLAADLTDEERDHLHTKWHIVVKQGVHVTDWWEEPPPASMGH